MGALSSTSPIQNTAAESPTGQNELNDNKITVEQIPKPRKFFKSRNAAPPAEIQQQMVMQQQTSYQHQQQSNQNHQPTQQEQNHYSSDGEEEEQVPKKARKKKVVVRKEKVEKPEKVPKPEKIQKPKKEKKVKVKEVPTPALDNDEDSEPEASSPARRGRSNVEPTRSSGRSRAKCVNYNEDAGEDEFYTRIDRRIVPRHLIPATITSPEEPHMDEPSQAPPAEGIPLPQQSPSLHPPIVLRISKVRENICFVITQYIAMHMLESSPIPPNNMPSRSLPTHSHWHSPPVDYFCRVSCRLSSFLDAKVCVINRRFLFD